MTAEIIIGAETPRDPSYIPLATAKKNDIPNSRGMELIPQKQIIAKKAFAVAYPDAKPRSITSTYNCVGMIFSSRRTRIDPKYLELIFTDDGYYRITDETQLKEGDLVIYRNQSTHEITHIAKIYHVKFNLEDATRSFIVLSKWGDHGEYFHPIDILPPILGKPSEFWSERRGL
ncbi:MAG: hypothetical protein V1799_03790 [bacterium]